MESMVDPAFEARWNNGMREFARRRKNTWNHGLTAGQSIARAEDLNRQDLGRAFRNNTFIYGTVGVEATHYGGAGSCRAVRTIHALNKASRPRGEMPRTPANFPGQPETWTDGAARAITRFMKNIKRKKDSYDPGVRAGAFLKNGYQMMDMYYGTHGRANNTFWRSRNKVIAEFVHYVMGYHEGPNGIPFDSTEPGWSAFARANPTAGAGWSEQPATTGKYGQSATKEISRIIRRGIFEFGGKIIFEGRDVFYSQAFSRQPATRDTDVEAQALLPYFWLPKSPRTEFGAGTLEFQWAGEPTTPTRAHFLTNWEFSGNPMTTHGPANRRGGFDDQAETSPWYDELLRLTGKRHNLRPTWHNFYNFPDIPGEGRYTNESPEMIALILAWAIEELA